MKDELEITKSCRNCIHFIYCRGTISIDACRAKNFIGFRPSRDALELQCAKLILQRDKAIAKMSFLEKLNAELNRALKKKNKEVSKLWKKLNIKDER